MRLRRTREARGLEDEVRHGPGFGKVALEAVRLQEGNAAELNALPHLAHEAGLAHAALACDQQAAPGALPEAFVDESLHLLHLAAPPHELAREEIALLRVLGFEFVSEAARAIEVGQQFARIAMPFVRVDRAEPLDHVAQPPGHRFPFPGPETHALGGLLKEKARHAVRGVVRHLAGEQLIGHHAQAVQIRPMIALRPPGDLRRQVFGRAHDLSSGAAQAGQAEVEDLHLTARPFRAHHDVAGLEVEVDDAALVEIGEGPDHGDQELDRIRPREDGRGRPGGRRPGARLPAFPRGVEGQGTLALPGMPEGLAQGRAREEFHGEEEGVEPRHHLEVVDARHVRVAQRRHGLELRAEQIHAVGHPPQEELERGRPARVELVVHAVDGTHAPAAQEPVDPVSAVQDETPGNGGRPFRLTLVVAFRVRVCARGVGERQRGLEIETARRRRFIRPSAIVRVAIGGGGACGHSRELRPNSPAGQGPRDFAPPLVCGVRQGICRRPR